MRPSHERNAGDGRAPYLNARCSRHPGTAQARALERRVRPAAACVTVPAPTDRTRRDCRVRIVHDTLREMSSRRRQPSRCTRRERSRRRATARLDGARPAVSATRWPGSHHRPRLHAFAEWHRAPRRAGPWEWRWGPGWRGLSRATAGLRASRRGAVVPGTRRSGAHREPRRRRRGDGGLEGHGRRTGTLRRRETTASSVFTPLPTRVASGQGTPKRRTAWRRTGRLSASTCRSTTTGARPLPMPLFRREIKARPRRPTRAEPSLRRERAGTPAELLRTALAIEPRPRRLARTSPSCSWPPRPSLPRRVHASPLLRAGESPRALRRGRRGSVAI